MKCSILATIVFATSVLADSHTRGVCAKNIRPHHPGGTPLSPGMGEISYDYDHLDVATKLACDAYRAQKTGYTCTDCIYNAPDATCLSRSKHLGGNEWYHYCKLQTKDPLGLPTGTIVT